MMVFGAAPSDGVAALRKRARQSSLLPAANAVISEPSVSRLASVVVCVLLSGSRSTLPHPPVTGSTRFGTLPAAIFNPSGLPEIASPLMNLALVNADATVVSSLTVTRAGGSPPSTARNASAGLSPAPLLTEGTPPLAIR